MKEEIQMINIFELKENVVSTNIRGTSWFFYGE